MERLLLEAASLFPPSPEPADLSDQVGSQPLTPNTVRAEKVSTLLSLLAAVVMVSPSYFQWLNITYNGRLRLRWWVRVLLAFVLAALGGAAILALLS
jgi:hypothetical protein